jgi:hypothetical protein
MSKSRPVRPTWERGLIGVHGQVSLGATSAEETALPLAIDCPMLAGARSHSASAGRGLAATAGVTDRFACFVKQPEWMTAKAAQPDGSTGGPAYAWTPLQSAYLNCFDSIQTRYRL